MHAIRITRYGGSKIIGNGVRAPRWSRIAWPASRA